MKISVLVPTYNHEKYIRQALDSILTQEVDCDFEIVIGEDASTDQTPSILNEYQNRYPNQIRVLLSDRAGAERDRKRGLGGKNNFIRTLKACRGEYVAFLDGDDYWTDTHKLQKQVDFLDTHPDFVICFHNVNSFFEDGTQAPENLLSNEVREVSSIEDLLKGNFIPAPSAMFRSGLVTDFPDWFLTLKIGDWPFYILAAQHGKIGYLNEVMAAYRVHRAAYWSYTGRSHQDITFLKMLKFIDEHLNGRYQHIINGTRARYYFELAELYCAIGRPQRALIPIKLGLKSSRFRHRGLLSLFLQVKVPSLYNALRGFRNLVTTRESNNPGLTP
jgi:glycosyltransferase involved in cell wall biosynthesis